MCDVFNSSVADVNHRLGLAAKLQVRPSTPWAGNGELTSPTGPRARGRAAPPCGVHRLAGLERTTATTERLLVDHRVPAAAKLETNLCSMAKRTKYGDRVDRATWPDKTRRTGAGEKKTSCSCTTASTASSNTLLVEHEPRRPRRGGRAGCPPPPPAGRGSPCPFNVAKPPSTTREWWSQSTVWVDAALGARGGEADVVHEPGVMVERPRPTCRRRRVPSRRRRTGRSRSCDHSPCRAASPGGLCARRHDAGFKRARRAKREGARGQRGDVSAPAAVDQCASAVR